MLPAYKPVLTLERQTIIYRLKLAAGLELKETNVNVPKCDLNEIGDQFHYIFRCIFLMLTERNMFNGECTLSKHYAL